MTAQPLHPQVAAIIEIVDATIERCAQVAHDWLIHHGYETEAVECAAAIRAISEEEKP